MESVVGKAGRAETPTGPAPLDIVETVINLRPDDYWLKRELRYEDAAEPSEIVLAEMLRRNWLVEPPDPDKRAKLINDATMYAVASFDKALRESALREIRQSEQELAPRLVHHGTGERALTTATRDGIRTSHTVLLNSGRARRSDVEFSSLL